MPGDTSLTLSRKGGFGHPNHTPVSDDLKSSIVMTIIVAITFAIVLAFAAASSNSSVSSNYTSAAVSASAIFAIVVFVATYEVLQYFVTHGIGKPEGREKYGA